jgi:hypothetical protein
VQSKRPHRSTRFCSLVCSHVCLLVSSVGSKEKKTGSYGRFCTISKQCTIFSHVASRRRMSLMNAFTKPILAAFLVYNTLTLQTSCKSRAFNSHPTPLSQTDSWVLSTCASKSEGSTCPYSDPVVPTPEEKETCKKRLKTCPYTIDDNGRIQVW